MSSDSQDVRTQLGIKDTFSGCFETTDNRFVKILEVSSINLSLMSNLEQNSIYGSWKTFLNEMQLIKSIQTAQIAQPVNLSAHLLHIDQITKKEKSLPKERLINSYKKYADQIQRSRNMVSRKRYVILDQKIGSNREKALSEIDQASELTKTRIENMIMGYDQLEVKIYNNDDLLKLLYTCVDYDNAQGLGEYIVGRATSNIPVSMDEKTAKHLVENLTRKLKDNIS